MKASPQLIKWAIAQGFATGHADTEQELLEELGRQVAELHAEHWRMNMLRIEVAQLKEDLREYKEEHDAIRADHGWERDGRSLRECVAGRIGKLCDEDTQG
jgi:predicted nuclease with TOPRIM domain